MFKKSTIKIALIVAFLAIAVIFSSAWYLNNRSITTETLEVSEIPQDTIVSPIQYAFGIPIDSFEVEKITIKSGQTFGNLLSQRGFSNAEIFKLANESQSVFDVTKINAGKPMTFIKSKDTLNKPVYVIYEPSALKYVVFDLSDSLVVSMNERVVKTVTKEAFGVINASLSQTMVDQDLSPYLAIRLSEIYAWTIDFFRIQKGDYFKVIYEEQYVDDTTYIGLGKIQAVMFHHFDKDLYAFHYKDTTGLWDFYNEDGGTLRKAFLKAPLNYSRISSRFSKRRFHPVQKRWKAHLGTDYAAPTGTPIMSTADGVVDRAGYTRGNGNYVKVRHNSTYSTQYLHMSKIAKGMKPGKFVRQGEVIGYVGSTGLATGPHVCYRFWKNGQQVDPFKQKLPDAEPINEAYKEDFMKQMTVQKKSLDKINIQP